MAKKAPAKRAPAKRKPRPKKPVPDISKEINGSISQEDYQRMLEMASKRKPIAWQSWVIGGLKAAALVGVGAIAGVWFNGGIDVSPDRGGKTDAVSEVFDAQESAFRRLSGERAKALRAGEIKTETESFKWMSDRYLPLSDAEWVKLLQSEAEAFGGEKWTAEKEAAHIEGYAR